MKKLLNKPQQFELEIVVVMEGIVQSEIAASEHPIKLEPRNELKVEYQLSPKELAAYRNFLSTVASIIENQGFIFVEEYQSTESYSYYIQFTPVLYDGILDNDTDHLIPRKSNSDVVLDVKFRLSNHRLPTGPIAQDSNSRNSASGRIITEFVVGNLTHSTLSATIKDVQEICADLKCGIYDRLLEV